MDPGSSTSVMRVSSNQSRGRVGDKDKEEKAKAQFHRSTRYKEKFQHMREKYDHATSLSDEYHRELQVANAKIKKLQAENNLLLDAMSIVAEKTPIYSYLPPEPETEEQKLALSEAPTPTSSVRDPHQIELSSSSVQRLPYPAHTNGGSNGYSNGARHRPIEHPTYDHGDASSTEHVPHTSNGRLP